MKNNCATWIETGDKKFLFNAILFSVSLCLTKVWAMAILVWFDCFNWSINFSLSKMVLSSVAFLLLSSNWNNISVSISFFFLSDEFFVSMQFFLKALKVGSSFSTK